MVEIVIFDILLEVSLLSLHLAFPIIGHLQAVYHIFCYLKQLTKSKLYFNPVSPLIIKYRFYKFDWEEFYWDSKEANIDDMPKPRDKIMTMHFFFYGNHAAYKVTRRSQTGILI